MQDTYLQTNIMRMCQEYSDENRLREIPRLIANARIESFEHGIYAALKFVREFNKEAESNTSAFKPTVVEKPRIVLTDGGDIA